MLRERLRSLTPEAFEELCKELLYLDGFKNVTLHAKGPDGGVDLTAERSYPIAHGQEHRITWLVQCKHVSTQRSLSSDKIKQILFDFETRSDCQGLIIVTNVKLSGPAVKRIKDLMQSRHRIIFHWDITDIEHFVASHPYLSDKFSLDVPSQALTGASSVRVLLITEGSVFAYHIHESLRRYGFDVRETRLHQFGSNALSKSVFELGTSFDVAYVFLAELYWIPIPTDLIIGLRASIQRGLKCVFTPFCAWSVGSAVNPTLDDLLPVSVRKHSVDVFSLLLPDPPDITSELRFPKYSDTFIENQRLSFKTSATDVFSRSFQYTGRNTNEFLSLKPGARSLVIDDKGNPILIVRENGHSITAYLNMCAHNCLTPFPLKSPVESSQDITQMLAEFTFWVGKHGEFSNS